MKASGPIRTLLGGRFEKISPDRRRRLVLDTTSRLIEALRPIDVNGRGH
jgi:hypothetical protein